MSQKYFDAPGLNFSLLADFQICADAVRTERKPTSYFENGKAFELIFQDMAQGSNFFLSRYFVANVKGGIPDKVVCALEAKQELSELYQMTEAGERSKTYKRLHQWLDVCQENPGKVPVSKSEFDGFCRMAENLMAAELFGRTVRDIAERADFQVPVYWTFGGIEKKALLDMEAEHDGEKFICDLKAMASLSMFRSGFFSRYFLQDVHYLEGVFATRPFENIHPAMIFLVATKESPFVAQACSMKPERRGEYNERYTDLCSRFAAWDQAGRPACGWKPFEYI